MKVISDKDFTKTLNLPTKNISVAVEGSKREGYFLEKIQDVKKYKAVIDRNIKNGGMKYKISEIPINIDDTLDSTLLINKIYKDVYIRHEVMLGNIVDHEVMFVSTNESQESDKEDAKESTVEDKKSKLKLLKKEDKNSKISNNQALIKLRQSNNLKLENEVRKQIQEINNLGTIMDYKKNNVTEFESKFRDNMLDIFLSLYESGKVKKELRPIHWCVKCAKSVNKKHLHFEKKDVTLEYIKYKVDTENGLFSKYKNLKNTYFIATTIFPWQMLSSSYIAVAKDVEYSLVEVKEDNVVYHYIIATDKVDLVMQLNFYVKYDKLVALKSEDLKKIICISPINPDKKIYVTDTKKEYIEVLANKGTGVNIVSAGNTYLDYLILKDVEMENKLLNVVDKKGKITTIDLNYANKPYTEAQEEITKKIEELNLMYSKENTKIKVPKCSTCNEDVIYRIISQWYIKKSDNDNELKENLLGLIDRMCANNRYKSNEYCTVINKINNVKETIISDERVVGTPIPTFYCAACGKEILSKLSIDVIKKLLKVKGIEQWHKLTPEEILEGQVSCECGCGFFFKDESTLNDFFGVVSTVLSQSKQTEEEKLTPKITIESKQTFFEKLLAISFSNNIKEEIDIINTAMIHSSIENVKKDKKEFDFKNAIEKYGTDILRLWAMSNSNKNVLRLNEQSIINTKFDYMAIRRTFKFLLSNLSDFNPLKDNISLVDRNDLDKVVYKNLGVLTKKLDENYKKIEFHEVYNTLVSYCKQDLCRDYFNTSKYNLYVLNKEDKKRRSVQSTFYDILMTLVVYLGPIIPFTLEEIWPFIWHKNNIEAENLLMYKYNKVKLEDEVKEECEKWKTIYYIRDRVRKNINNAKQKQVIKNDIEAKVIINTKEKQKEFIDKNHEELKNSLNVSLIEVNIKEKPSIRIEKAPGTQCVRCKEYSVDIGMDFKYRYLCPKCSKILHELEK